MKGFEIHAFSDLHHIIEPYDVRTVVCLSGGEVC